MVRKIISSSNSKETQVDLKMDGSIPLCLMSEEQYGRYKLVEEVSTLTNTISYKEDGETLEVLYTFLNPITKGKYNLVYNDKQEKLFIIPDNALNIEVGVTRLELIGYGIGASNEYNKNEFLNFKKDYDSEFKIKLDKTKLEALKSKIKLSVLNICGTNYGSNRVSGHFAIENHYLEFNSFPTALLRIDFTDEIMSTTLDVSILTTYNLNDDKLISAKYVDKDIIQANVVFLPL